MSRYFGDAQGFRKPADGGLVRGDIPSGVRNAAAGWVSQEPTAQAAARYWRFVVRALDLDPRRARSSRLQDGWNQSRLVEFLLDADWWLFLEACTAIYDEASGSMADHWREEVNSRLIRYGSAYLMAEDGRVYEQGAAPADEVIADARAILRDERLGGPDHQFALALEAYNKRPNFDAVGTISGSINAVEGIARAALDDPKVNPGPALKRMKEDHDLHGALTDSIANLYGYASQDGGRHGLTDNPRSTARSRSAACIRQQPPSS
jgi:hypothetical protein